MLLVILNSKEMKAKSIKDKLDQSLSIVQSEINCSDSEMSLLKEILELNEEHEDSQ